MSILDHVVYAKDKKSKQPKPKNQTGLSIPAIDNSKPKVIKPSVKPRIIAPDANPLRFKKIPGEKEQLKAMRLEFRQKIRSVNSTLTNKQISNTFGSRVVVTT